MLLVSNDLFGSQPATKRLTLTLPDVDSTIRPILQFFPPLFGRLESLKFVSLQDATAFVALIRECFEFRVISLTTVPNHVPNVTELCMFESARLVAVDSIG